MSKVIRKHYPELGEEIDELRKIFYRYYGDHLPARSWKPANFFHRTSE